MFYAEVMQDNEEALKITRKALVDAMNKIDDIDEEVFRDAKNIIELLKENLMLWKKSVPGGEEDDDFW